MPTKDNGDSKNNWFSYNYGSVHFIFLSFEHDFLKNSIQYKWFENDLKSINRKETPWVVLSAHRPLYCSANYTDDARVVSHIQKEMDSLFYGNVDIAFYGHYHSYERSYKTVNYQVNSTGTVHVLTGSAGYLDSEDAWINPQPSWSAKRFCELGYTKIHIKEDTLTLNFISSINETILDTYVLKK